MREEEKEEEKKQKRNGQLPSAKRGLFFYCRTMGKMSRTRTTGPSNIFRNSLSRGGVTRHLVHLENFSAIISSDVSGIH